MPTIRHPHLRCVALLCALALLSGCGGCGNEIAQTVPSPSGRLKAVAFNRNCGATTGDNTQLSILAAADALPNDPGNVLIVDDSLALQLHWQSDARLQVSGLDAAKPVKQRPSVMDVAIGYGQ